jgi:hypothetical protein
MGPRPDWKAFELLELPLHEVEAAHFETCMVCKPQWHRSAFAYHEATHAAVAQHLDLPVEFVAIDEEQEIEVTAEEAALYPVIHPGMKIPALGTRLSPGTLRRHPVRVLTAMVAPSCVSTGYPHVDSYAAVEACIGVESAKARGFDPDMILDRAKRTVELLPVQKQILHLAGWLALAGWVDLGG